MVEDKETDNAYCEQTSFELDVIFNERCEDTMKHMHRACVSVDLVLTSPPYNTNKKFGKKTVLDIRDDGTFPYLRYDTVMDTMTNEEYTAWTVDLFRGFSKVVKPNGVVLYNMSYGNENTEVMLRTLCEVITQTEWTLADIISWKKSNALPNNVSPNRLTRIVEYIYVLCRRGEEKTFHCNKPVTSVRSNGQRMYGGMFNFVEAKNNDGVCPYNKATFSSDLVFSLLTMYGVKGGVVYDPFMGSGTTAIGALRYGCSYIGSEISENQVKYARERISEWMSHNPCVLN